MAEKVDIPGFPGYQVSSTGVVYGRKGHPLKLRKNINGHAVYELYEDEPGKKRHQLTPARCVALGFLGPADGRFACRIKGDSDELSNIQWKTRSEARSKNARSKQV